jgi:hypothetical protein
MPDGDATPLQCHPLVPWPSCLAERRSAAYRCDRGPQPRVEGDHATLQISWAEGHDEQRYC